jgi:hypothetical protein
VNPQIAAAQQLIGSLKAGGMSYAEIGRRVGRDVSYISQAARGKKGGNLVGPLQQIIGGAKKAEPPRRTTKGSTTQAKVRRGIQKSADGNISVKTKTGDKTLIKGLKEGGTKPVKWKLRFKKLKTQTDREVTKAGVNGGSARNHPWTADKLLNRIQNPQPGDNWRAGQARKAMAEIAMRENSNAFTSYVGIEEVQMYTF